MESYIEVSFLTNLMICLIAFYGSSCFSFSGIKMRMYYPLVLFEQLCVILLFTPRWYFFFYAFEIAFHIFFFRQWKRIFLYVSIKYILSFSCFKVFGGSFHLWHYFVPVNVHMYGIWLLFLFVIITLQQKWHAYLKVSDFIFPITIYADKKLQIRAFLDTGNNVMLHQLPILFLDASYRIHMLGQKKEEVSVCTLNRTEVLSAYLCKVKVGRNKIRPCYICCDKRVALEWGCVCLLNIEM